MEALNAAAAVLPPISCLFDRRTEPRKNPSPFLPISPLKTSTSPRFVTNPPTLRECLSKGFHGGLVLLSSVVNAELARALTYEEALQQSVTSSDGVISFGVDNPAIVFGGVAVLALPLLLSQFLNKPNKPWGVDSARSAYEKLGVDATAQLLDIRPPGDVKAAGTPNLKGLGKKSVSLVYKGEDKPGFLKKLALKFKDPQNTTLFILDKFDGNSELVAELVTVNGFKAAYAVKDGAEGPRGWIKSGLPWIEPKKSFSLDFSSLTDSFGAIGDGVEGLSVALAVAAATGFGLLTFTEIETILQLLGSVALIQLVSKKLLLAEDRQATLKQVDEFLSNEVAPNELFDDVKAIGKAFLPPIVSKSLPAPAAAPVEASAPAPAPAPVEASAPAPAVAPVEASAPAPAEASAEPVSVDSTVQKAEVPVPELKLEAAPEVKSAPVAEVQAESNGGFPRPQSPFPYYPDLKPPSSPTPSQP